MADWVHINALSYDHDRDRIMLTVRGFSEFWIIDHSTTSAEAKGHTGGRSGMGGDLLFRWGNPQAYRAGTMQDQQLFAPHGAHWIPRGRPGAGHALVFNNGVGRPGREYSSVDEIVLPIDTDGRYLRKPRSAYGPAKPVWSYTATNQTDFYAGLLSSAQRLPNGNTFICHGVSGTIFEVSPHKKIVWSQPAPSIASSGPGGLVPQSGRLGAAPRPHESLASEIRNTLKMSSEQNRDLSEFQKEVDARLDATLTDGQKKRLREMGSDPPGGFGSFAELRRMMSLTSQIVLKLTGKQKQELAELQKRVDARLAQILTANQKVLFEKMNNNFGGPAMSGRRGPTTAAHGKFASPATSGTGGPGDFTGNLPPGMNPVFSAFRYEADYPGLAGKDLRPEE